jgi:hypothetical protein
MNLALAVLLCGTLLAPPRLREIDLRLPSTAAEPGGLALRVVVPASGRYGPVAPVAIVVPGGWQGSSLARLAAPLAPLGFIEVRFTFPGEGEGEGRSGGMPDLRGPRAVQAVADVASFAASRTRASDGRTLAEIVAPLALLGEQSGMLALSNGGNTALLALSGREAACRGVGWVVTWETPFGDAAAAGLYGVRGEQPNPAYDPATGRYDASSLAWDPFLLLRGVLGGFYHDLNHNGRCDTGDWVLDALVQARPDGTRVLAYPLVVLREAERRRLCGARWPAAMLGSSEAEGFWRERNADGCLAALAISRPDLLAMVVASDQDHVQSAPDHPHVFGLYDGWRRAGLPFVRLNPDAAYLGAVLGGLPPGYLETPANAVLAREALPRRLAPAGAVPRPMLLAAAAAELADRSRQKATAVDLEAVLFPVDRL